ncbi:MAG: 4-(cytidine 5'-diphospho)-2-C-methyl-D-erythritol kinase [Gemmatimonadaceae bacterium]
MSGRAARTLAQAKVNLALLVFAKEADGYHSIETVFLRLDLGDDVEIRTTRGQKSLKCFEMRDEPPEKNLAWRAAELYARETGWPSGFEIEIIKNVPVGGGLGGGSADAAAVLRILNKLATKPLATEKILNMASGLGSDVPFLASDNVMALAWGRGERMLSLEPLPRCDIQLFFLPFGIDTGEAYAMLDKSRGEYKGPGPSLTAEMFTSWESAARHSSNDFEPVMRTRSPEIDALLERGERYGHFYRMSGSGSTVFKVSGVSTPSVHAEPEPPMVETPAGITRIVTRTAESVVPVHLLD